MINSKHKTRLNKQNSEYIMNRFIKDTIKQKGVFENTLELKIDSEEKIIELIKELEIDIVASSATIDPDWAMPIIMEIIGKIYYGKFTMYQAYGNSFKRALAYLWNNVFDSNENPKDTKQLIDLVYKCYILEGVCSFQKIFWAIDGFYFYFDKGKITVPKKFNEDLFEFSELIKGRGKRLRVAECNTNLMLNNQQEYLQGLISIINGATPNEIPIFKGTFFANIPSVDNCESIKSFWQELLLRYSAFLLVAKQTKQTGEVIVFHEFALEGIPDLYLTQTVVENIFWKKEWFDKQSTERYSNLIVERPIMRINKNGDFATSAILIGDSINKFIEKSIRATNKNENNFFKQAISEPFEERCINLFRELGFDAGHVTEKGTWKTQTKDINMRISNKKFPGEIDVLAYQHDKEHVFLIECKVLKDVEDTETYKSLVSKLKNDDEFKTKLLKKSQWLKESFLAKFNKDIDPILIILTDIPLPVIGLNDSEVTYTNFLVLKKQLYDYYQ